MPGAAPRDVIKRKVSCDEAFGSAATTPWALALPLEERPRHLILVVCRRPGRQYTDEVHALDVCRGGVPRRREELIRAVVDPVGADDDVVAPTLDTAGADEER